MHTDQVNTLQADASGDAKDRRYVLKLCQRPFVSLQKVRTHGTMFS
jgi:hypothetical protein